MRDLVEAIWGGFDAEEVEELGSTTLSPEAGMKEVGGGGESDPPVCGAPARGEARPKDHIYAGRTENGSPLYLPANCHWDICGASGSGKSAFIGNVLVQHILTCPDVYLCMIDLGGDPFLRHLCREACEKAGRTFREFTLGTSFRFYFDPIAACTANASVDEQAAIVTNGLGLWYGSGYGKSYHGSANREEIEGPLERMHKAGIPPTLHGLADEQQRGRRVRTRDISEAELRLRSMRRVPQLSISDDPAQQITFSSGFDIASLDYFYLPAHRDEVVPVNVATMACAGVLNEAVTRRERGFEPRFAHLFIDEVALLNGARTMESKLPMARKWVSMKLIYQYRSQWYEHGRYMPDSLAANCPVSIRFSASCEEDFRDLELQSDDEIKQIGSVTMASLSVRKTVRDELRPRLERNKIREITWRDGWAFFTGSARKGDPLPFRIAYPTTIEEHERLSLMPITPTENGIVGESECLKSPRLPSKAVDTEERKKRHDIVRQIIRAKQELERWETT